MNSINGTIDLLLSLVAREQRNADAAQPHDPAEEYRQQLQALLHSRQDDRRCTGSCSVSPASMTRWKPATPLSTSAPAYSWGWLWAVWPFCLMRQWINKV